MNALGTAKSSASLQAVRNFEPEQAARAHELTNPASVREMATPVPPEPCRGEGWHWHKRKNVRSPRFDGDLVGRIWIWFKPGDPDAGQCGIVRAQKWRDRRHFMSVKLCSYVPLGETPDASQCGARKKGLRKYRTPAAYLTYNVGMVKVIIKSPSQVRAVNRWVRLTWPD